MGCPRPRGQVVSVRDSGLGRGPPWTLAAPPWGQRPEAPSSSALGAGYALAPHWDLPAQVLTWLSPSVVSKP